jgi:Holliday junction resolvase RusA-like endonuclease
MPPTMERRSVQFTVFGIAQPKGSTRAFVPKGWTRPIITGDNPRTKGWQQLVAEQAQTVARDGLFLGPVVLRVTFHLPRPQSLPKRVLHHTKKPDLDKLCRSTKDALKGVLYADDAQVVELDARKVYAAIGAAPCAIVTVEEAADRPMVQAPLEAESLFAGAAR